ncbi:S66 family peptidase [Bacillus paralicheniformis]|uniref:Muramoyltetrapeptide carboxypeptidase n=1 Tax=Bacillus paralicheniformis TaxID=1648923 RepID=A0A7Z9CM52_9BACI|nr:MULTISPECIES: LD-carboxypeptidase [Bacillus]ETB72278.1 peptidase S66 [Bacillus sp. CPSM8]MBC8623463.1 LD-carboxypeptidase [Robertmurraya crescens]AJO18517.1 carboxypeptidase [Bacillus paralicheniformis]ARA85989.1 LD-carboxypeptidase [Bacillus paralicheniformis]MBL7474900.1 LD-carboxypeptidase [Bacillus paralicheniformis]
MFPEKLQPGDEIRVIAPSRSLSLLNTDKIEKARTVLNNLGFRISFSAHANEIDECSSSSIQSRVSDLHDSFSDQRVKGILTVLGGYNSNQLLSHLNYELIKANPKVFCGFSDITALSAAIYAKTGLVTYSGPHFSSFSMGYGLNYMTDYFLKCCCASGVYDVEPSSMWCEEIETEECPKQNSGPVVINEGSADGKIIGGNLCTLNLLQGTEYFPDIKNAVLFLEDDWESPAAFFDRDLQSLLHLPDFSGVKAVLIGRFQTASAVTLERLKQIVQTKKELSQIPVIANIDFGHTTPFFTFPIGGRCRIDAQKEHVSLCITKH